MLDEYIPVERAAQLLNVTTRHAHRACHKAGVRASKAGKRTLYHRLDVERLAAELGAEYRHVEMPPTAPPAPETAATSTTEPSTALVPYDALQRQLSDVQHELAEVKRLLARLVEQSAAPDTPSAESTKRRPWWMRIFR